MQIYLFIKGWRIYIYIYIYISLFFIKLYVFLRSDFKKREREVKFIVGLLFFMSNSQIIGFYFKQSPRSNISSSRWKKFKAFLKT